MIYSFMKGKRGFMQEMEQSVGRYGLTEKRFGQRERKSWYWLFGFLIFLAGFNVILLEPLVYSGGVCRLPFHAEETEAFREMRMSEEAIGYLKEFQDTYDVPVEEVLAVWMGISEFHLERFAAMPDSVRELEYFLDCQAWYLEHQKEQYQKLLEAYRAVISDIVYFPIPKSRNPRAAKIYYSDGWGSERIYQDASHVHEGCDIMAGNNERGYFPIVSMTDGVVERIGWLEKGGYRIGIRSPSGGYFYYAHLYRYAQEWKEGDVVRAGDFIGFMGDSGYSKVEGTVGNFAVHLHLGIYIQTEHYYEQSVNPYWILRYFEEQRLGWDY